MSACVEIPQCVELKPSTKKEAEGVLHINVINKCDYDLIVFLQIRNKQNQLLYSTSIDLKASEEKSVEVSMNLTNAAAISGEWSLKGTSLKLPLKEIPLNP
ncbi:MAG: hypothetical protein QXL96_01135 [Ignisphaera sp.]